MSEQNSTDGRPAQGWNTYWEGASGNQAFTSGGARHPGFPAFWSGALTEYLASKSDARILDIATGSGAVIESLSSVPCAKLSNVSCIDIAAPAIEGVRSRFPEVTGVVADANSIPLDSESFDLITSQFGVEYAGPGGIDEAVRLLAPGGQLIFLVHYHSGEPHRQCLATVDALSRVRQCDFFPLAKQFFVAGFAAVRGADRTPYQESAKALNPVVKELESIMIQHTEKAADGTVSHLYSTLQNIHNRIQYYEPDEVLAWLASMDGEVSMQLERMKSMNNCAFDKAAIEGIRTILVNKGMSPSQAEPLEFEGEALPFAWALQAAKR